MTRRTRSTRLVPTAPRTPRPHRATLAFALTAAASVLLAGCTAPAAAPVISPTETTPALERPAAPEGDLPPELVAELQQTLDDTMAEYTVPGGAVGVWIPGEGSWTAVAGIADVDTDEPVTADMQWPIRSITKSYTVTLILQLVDEGVLSLDDTIDQYIDGITDGDTITLRQLADMSSGNSDYFTDAFIQDFFIDDPERLFTLDELNGYVVDQPAQFAPGTEKVYTNANTNLLGKVVEVATGQDFAEALNERILEPLGQTGTRYITDVSTWSEPHALGYSPAETGTGWEDQIPNFSVLGPAGSMVTTLDDARVWGQMLAEGTLLDAATQAERQQGAPLDAGPPYDIYALGMGETDGWWGHNGEGLGYTAATFHDDDTGATIAVFFNLSDYTPKAHPADQLFRRLAAVIEGE
ncbi:serine hydrolase domain-containing protein [Microbacterium aurantiacum]|uniref:Beta-lactamase family protein n=1 Tax=Microbacterium aurantiacum TaxID=162393 RepID=A0ABT8FX35_9MICO|nr:serine hydrolase domain-containing protein [Microbacterium aurantiacum]MDN4465672.1 beta-lactamase family protein [Microbacterium aurantiacum]